MIKCLGACENERMKGTNACCSECSDKDGCVWACSQNPYNCGSAVLGEEVKPEPILFGVERIGNVLDITKVIAIRRTMRKAMEKHGK